MSSSEIVQSFRSIVDTVIDENIVHCEENGALPFGYKQTTRTYGMEFVRVEKDDSRMYTFGSNIGETLWV